MEKRFVPSPLVGEGNKDRISLGYPNSISSSISCVRLTPPRVRTIFAGNLSWPLRRPASIASRTAFSISRCEVMPNFLRNLRRLEISSRHECHYYAVDWCGLGKSVSATEYPWPLARTASFSDWPQKLQPLCYSSFCKNPRRYYRFANSLCSFLEPLAGRSPPLRTS